MEVFIVCDQNPATSLEASAGLCRLKLPIVSGTRHAVLRFAIPLQDIQQFWHPVHQGVERYLPWNFEVSCAFQARMPVISFSNRANLNRMTIALDDLVDDTFLRGSINQEKCTYDITIEMALPSDTPAVTLTLDSREGISWMNAIAAWRESLDLVCPAFPEAAWDPVYCSWYAIHAEVNQSWVEQSAPLAKALGFTTLILDDGWCYDDAKRVSPETIASWYQDVGDWQVATKKFPSFSEHVRRIQSLGMKYLVWVAPTLIGERSHLLAEHPEATRGGVECSKSYGANLDDQEVVNLLAEKCRVLVAENHLDGLKVDFLDHEDPSLTDPRGRKMQRFVQAIAQGIRAGAQEALIEFRQGYATPNTLAFGTQFRACDAPFDYLLNLERCLQIRVMMGDDVPIHADPAYWGAHETPENISRHFIAMMAAVPMLSMDLATLTDMEKSIITHWMGFYREHKTTLNHGVWKIHYEDGNIDYALVQHDGEAIAIVLTATAVNELPKGTMVLNLTPTAIPISVSKAWNLDGREAPATAIPIAGRGTIA